MSFPTISKLSAFQLFGFMLLHGGSASPEDVLLELPKDLPTIDTVRWGAHSYIER